MTNEYVTSSFDSFALKEKKTFKWGKIMLPWVINFALRRCYATTSSILEYKWIFLLKKKYLVLEQLPYASMAKLLLSEHLKDQCNQFCHTGLCTAGDSMLAAGTSRHTDVQGQGAHISSTIGCTDRLWRRMCCCLCRVCWHLKGWHCLTCMPWLHRHCNIPAGIKTFWFPPLCLTPQWIWRVIRQLWLLLKLPHSTLAMCFCSMNANSLEVAERTRAEYYLFSPSDHWRHHSSDPNNTGVLGCLVSISQSLSLCFHSPLHPWWCH